MIAIIVALILGGIFALTASLIRSMPLARFEIANPIVLPITFATVQTIDFIYLAYDSRPHLRDVAVSASQGEILIATAVYGALIAALVVGMLLGVQAKVRPTARAKVELPETTAAGLLAIFFAIVMLYMFWQLFGFNAELADVSANKSLTSAAAPMFPIFTWAAVITCGLYLSISRARLAILLAVAAVAAGLSIITGARIHIVTIGVFFLLAWSRRGGKWPIRYLPFIALPAFFLFTVLRSIRANSGGLAGFFYDRGGALATVFGSDEVGNAETMTFGLQHLHLPFMSRWPGEGMVGLLMGPIPRTIISWKPEPVSTQFTQYIAPGTWYSARSQMVIGAPMEFCAELGPILAIGAMFLCGLAIGYLLKRASARSHIPAFWYGAVAIGLFVFLRTDLAGLGVFAWPLVLSYGCWRAFSVVVAAWAPPKRPTTARRLAPRPIRLR